MFSGIFLCFPWFCFKIRTTENTKITKRTGFTTFAGTLTLVLFLILVSASAVTAQKLPSSIRGYKVHSEKIVITSISAKPDGKGDAIVKVEGPELVDVGLSGITFEFPAEALSSKQSGKVDFLTFHDFEVNGIKVTIPEYSTPFSFKKGESFRLPQPAKIFLPTTSIANAAWKEMHESREIWQVTGRIFVYGKFRKFGFDHKRVVPVDVNITIENPLVKILNPGK